MKVYKITSLFIDFDEVGKGGDEAVEELLEHARLGNHIIPPRILSMESVDIGEWHDKHPLNMSDKARDAEIERLFPRKP